jgi:hypothetical protein
VGSQASAYTDNEDAGGGGGRSCDIASKRENNTSRESASRSGTNKYGKITSDQANDRARKTDRASNSAASLTYTQNNNDDADKRK